MDVTNKDWMALPRASPLYISGVGTFLDMTFQRSAQGQEILCPFKKCCNRCWEDKVVVKDHLIAYGFLEGYTEWSFHGEGMSIDSNQLSSHNEELDTLDDMNGMLHDICENEAGGEENSLRIDAKKFKKLMEEGGKELYPGCKNFTRLSLTMRLTLFKCLHGISNVAFDYLLDLLNEAFTQAAIPKSFNEAKNIVKDLGLDYQKIHACPNDCMLYMDEHKKASNCHICGISRWKSDDTGVDDSTGLIPANILRYFPLIPRLQRLYMCEETSIAMRWHANSCPNDGYLRHPADAIAWKDFDNIHPDFAQEPRSVRLALASDGFNPFRTMSISHSTWPVVLVNYNLSPLIMMKFEYLMLSMIIPGPKSPSQDIDIYLQPLIKELKELWEIGVETYDCTTNQTFCMRVALLWTISDFPAYAMLSGWSTKEKYACPNCNYETCSQYLEHSRKTCYMGSRKHLDNDHPLRLNTTSFNGHVELGDAPVPLSGSDVEHKLRNFQNIFGKTQKKLYGKNNP